MNIMELHFIQFNYHTKKSFQFAPVLGHILVSPDYRSASWCSEEKDCAACTAAEGCSWCHWSRECVSDNLCKDRTNPVAKSDACPKDEEPRPCFFATECYACKKLRHCSWFLMKDSKWKCVNNYGL